MHIKLLHSAGSAPGMMKDLCKCTEMFNVCPTTQNYKERFWLNLKVGGSSGSTWMPEPCYCKS